jgi:hypothetical protein
VFDFFENFTNASALLIKLKHTIEADEPGLAKDEIRARLTKRLFVELQKTPVEQVIGVAYLPTNPHWMVHDIVASKSFALQSAAKVPLFVSFTVSDRQHLPHTIAAVPDDVGAEQQRNDSDGYESDSEGDDDPDSVVATRHGVVAVNDALLDSMFDAASGDEDEYDDDEDDDDPDAVPSSALPSEKSEREAINKILGQTVSRRIREVAGDDEGDDDDDDDEDAGDVKLKPLSARGTANGTSGKRRAKKRASKASTALVAAAASKLTSSNAVALSTTSSAAAAVVAPHAAVVDAIVSDASLSRHERMKRLLETQPRNKRMQACIFKAGDDIRQDMLAIQIIELFKTILDDVGLDVYLYPYKVIATRPGCGIIEVVPNAKSRDAIGKYLDGNLMDYFISKYGPVNSEPFQRARTNFIQSMAAYAVVSYILQVKDRHNGNILIDDEGHLVHIDFGFIFDISPGGDFGFEVSPFKLSQEMIDVMGGEPGAEQFTYFMEQCVRAFLACRTHMESIITLVELMLETKLPCFKPGCIQRLRERFFPDKSEADAAVAMSAVALKAFSLIPFYTGYYYDVFQKMSQGISF